MLTLTKQQLQVSLKFQLFENTNNSLTIRCYGQPQNISRKEELDSTAKAA